MTSSHLDRQNQCARNLEILCQVCHQLGFPLELDLEMHLPADKLRDLRQEVANWHLRRAVTKRQLLSLGGLPTPPKCLRRMIDLAAKAKELHHWALGTPNQEFCSDLRCF